MAARGDDQSSCSDTPGENEQAWLSLESGLVLWTQNEERRDAISARSWIAARRCCWPRDVGSSDGGTRTRREYPASQSRKRIGKRVQSRPALIPHHRTRRAVQVVFTGS